MSTRERIRRFGTLLKVYREREEKKAARLREAQSALRREQTQLEGLDGLREEYRTQIEAVGKRGASAATLKNYRRFMTGLDELRSEQSDRTSKVEAVSEVRRKEWIGAHQRAQGISKLEEKLTDDLADQVRREEQRALDEARRK